MSTPRADPIASFLQRYPSTLLWIMYLMIIIAYFYVAHLLMGNIFATTPTDYYIYQLDAFAHGRVNVTPPTTYDLSIYHGKWYLYWGWGPLFFLWPFYLIWGLHASDVIYTLLGGLANVALSYLCVREVKRYFNISLSLQADLFLLVSFAFASPNFILSLTGQIWATSQIFATTALLLFCYFFFRYLNTGKQYQLLVAVAWFCLACLSRYSLIFNGILLSYLFWDSKVTGKKIPLRLLFTIGVMGCFFVALGAWCNYLKFQNISEVGLRFVQGASRYTEIEKSGKLISLSYFWHNVYYCFLNPVTFSWSNYIIKTDPDGNSIFLFYPSVLLCPVLFFKYKQLDLKKRSFVMTVAVAVLLTVLSLMVYFSDGWYQIGYRYFLDAYPLCFLLLVLALPYISEKIQWAIVTWGLGINLFALLPI